MLFTLGWWGSCSHVRLLVFVLLHSFTGCHGHYLQGEQLTAAFVISFITPCIPCISLLSMSWQYLAKRNCFYTPSEAQFPDLPWRYAATPAHLEHAADRLLLDDAQRLSRIFFLSFVLIWNKQIPCPSVGTVVIMSPASASSASESTTSLATVCDEEPENPRGEVRSHCFQCAGQFFSICSTQRIASVKYLFGITMVFEIA